MRTAINPSGATSKPSFVSTVFVRTSIFLDAATDDLFAYVEVESEAHWQAIAVTPVCRRWWASMRELMPANADGSPVSRPLAEVFHLERADVPSS